MRYTNFLTTRFLKKLVLGCFLFPVCCLNIASGSEFSEGVEGEVAAGLKLDTILERLDAGTLVSDGEDLCGEFLRLHLEGTDDLNAVENSLLTRNLKDDWISVRAQSDNLDPEYFDLRKASDLDTKIVATYISSEKYYDDTLAPFQLKLKKSLGRIVKMMDTEFTNPGNPLFRHENFRLKFDQTIDPEIIKARLYKKFGQKYKISGLSDSILKISRGFEVFGMVSTPKSKTVGQSFEFATDIAHARGILQNPRFIGLKPGDTLIFFAPKNLIDIELIKENGKYASVFRHEIDAGADIRRFGQKDYEIIKAEIAPPVRKTGHSSGNKKNKRLKNIYKNLSKKSSKSPVRSSGSFGDFLKILRKKRIDLEEGVTTHIGKRMKVKTGKNLGEGAVGSVHSVTLIYGNKKLKLAAKEITSIRDDATFARGIANSVLVQDNPHFTRYYGQTTSTNDNIVLLYEKAQTDLWDSLMTEKRKLPAKFNKRQAISDLFDGILFLHSKNKIHGDIKLENLLVTKTGKLKIHDVDDLVDNSTGLSKRPLMGIWSQTPGVVPPEGFFRIARLDDDGLRELYSADGIFKGDYESIGLKTHDVFSSGVAAMEITAGKPFSEIFEDVTDRPFPVDEFNKDGSIDIKEYILGLQEFYRNIKNKSARYKGPDWDIFADMVNPDPFSRITMSEASSEFKSLSQ